MPRERRYADWRPVATRRIPARWIGVLVGSLTLLALSVALNRPNYAFFVGATSLGGFVSNRIAARRLAKLRDEADDRQFGVTLRLKREAVYGLDEGLISFEDGYLIYMGRRCAFSLGSEDVRVVKKLKNEFEFAFDGPGGEHLAHIELKGDERFVTALVAWTSVHRRSLDSVLPPDLPDPSLSRPAAAIMKALPTVAVGLAIAMARAKPSSLWMYTIGVGSAIVGIALVVAIREVHALNRIARGEPRPRSLSQRWHRWRKRQLDRELSAPHARLEPSVVQADEHNANRLTERA